jgi:hypothetical protein
MVMTVTFINTANVVDTPTLAIAAASGVAFTYIEGHPYLYVGSYSEGGISAFSIDSIGQVTNVTDPGGNIHDSDDANLAIGGSTSIATFSIGSASFL